MAAVPLSSVFREMLGDDALTRGSEPDTFFVVCPFHDDKNPSLSLTDVRKVFHCFGCQASGNVFSLEMRWRGLQTVPEVIASFAERYPEVKQIVANARANGASLSTAPRNSVAAGSVYSPPAPYWRQPKKVKSRAWGEPLIARRESMLILAKTQEYFLNELAASVVARDYLAGRGVSENVVEEIGFGYAPGEDMVSCLKMLMSAGFGEEACVRAGVAKQNKSGQVYDVFRDRIMLPIRNAGGEVVSFAGRLLGESETAPKYINGPSTPVFQKKEHLYGVDLVLNAEETSARLEFGMLLLVEGYMDVAAIHGMSDGKVASVASMGTAVSREQLESALDLLGDRVDGKLVINLDGDDAGVAAAVRLCESVLPSMTNVGCVYIAQPPEFVKDVGEFLERDNEDATAEAYAKLIEERALPWIEWRVLRILKDVLDAQATKQSAAQVAQAAELGALGDGVDDEEGHIDGLPGSVSQTSFVSERIRQENMLLLQSMSGDDGNADGGDAEQEIMGGKLVSRMSGKERRQKRAAKLASSRAPRELEDVVDSGDASIGGCPAAVLDEVGVFMSKALRVSPGLNLPWLVHRWADMLSAGSTKRVPILHEGIMAHIDKHASSWERKSPARLIDLMPTPPWVLEEVPGSRKIRGKLNHVPGSEVFGTQFDISGYLQDKRRRKGTIDRVKIQEQVLDPEIERRRSEPSTKLKTKPRASAEEIILRSLLWANNDTRLEALEALLEVMIEVEEAGLFPFWTSSARAMLFEYLVDTETSVTVEEMAGECEQKEWWTLEVELLFVPAAEYGDDELKTIREIELTHPIITVTQAATAIQEMAKKVATGRAVDELGSFMQTQLDDGAPSTEGASKPSDDAVKDIIDGVSGMAFKSGKERKELAEASIRLEEEMKEARAVQKLEDSLMRGEYVEMDAIGLSNTGDPDNASETFRSDEDEYDSLPSDEVYFPLDEDSFPPDEALPK